MINLIEKYIKYHKHRKEYYVKPCVKFGVWSDYTMCFLPTVIFTPWFTRYPNSPVVTIAWLTMHLDIGEFKARERNDWGTEG